MLKCQITKRFYANKRIMLFLWSRPTTDSFEPRHDKTNKMSAPSEDSDQPGHLPSLIRVFAVCMKKAWILGYPLSAQRRLWSDWADAKADLSLRWAHNHFVGFVMSWLFFFYITNSIFVFLWICVSVTFIFKTFLFQLLVIAGLNL